ncbi:phage major tail tube protein [Pseudomonas chlororaphis]|nr:phage major tail tube protein [Pseudomonas chlororaphis]
MVVREENNSSSRFSASPLDAASAAPISRTVGDPAETKHAVSVNYYKLEVGGVVIYEIDMVGNVLVVNGVDQQADERSALGL